MAPQGDYVYVSTNTAGPTSVLVLDTTTNQWIATRGVGTIPHSLMAISPDGAYLYAPSGFPTARNVLVIDTAQLRAGGGTAVTVVPVPGAGDLRTIALTPDDGAYAYVADSSTRIVFVIDTAQALTSPANAVVGTIVPPVPFGTRRITPTGLPSPPRAIMRMERIPARPASR